MGVSYLAQDTLAKNAGVLIKESFFGRSDPSSGKGNTSYESRSFSFYEAAMLMSLNHPNLPSVRELAIRLVEHVDLRHFILSSCQRSRRKEARSLG